MSRRRDRAVRCIPPSAGELPSSSRAPLSATCIFRVIFDFDRDSFSRTSLLPAHSSPRSKLNFWKNKDLTFFNSFVFGNKTFSPRAPRYASALLSSHRELAAFERALPCKSGARKPFSQLLQRRAENRFPPSTVPLSRSNSVPSPASTVSTSSQTLSALAPLLSIS